MLQNRASDVPQLKGEKELKPVSLRVKDAAEGLLTIIMDHVVSDALILSDSQCVHACVCVSVCVST